MASTARNILDIAASQVGEKASDIKKCKYNTWFYGSPVSGRGYDWCETFVQWVFNEAVARDLLYTVTANCGAQAKAFFDKGRLVTKDYRPGDVVFFCWGSGMSTYVPSVRSCDHVGIIESVNSNGTITTIEGNTGSSSNGEVMRRTRSLSVVSCAGRPDYEDDDITDVTVGNGSTSPAASGSVTPALKTVTATLTLNYLAKSGYNNDPEQVKTVQRLLRSLGYVGKDGKALELDGVFGVNTDHAVREYQKAHTLSVDGVVGIATWKSLLCSKQ